MKKPYEIHNVAGIKTVFYPLKELPAVVLRLVVHAGSWFENEGEDGAFHLLEHLTCQKTVGFPSMQMIEEFKEENGLYSNAYTGGRRLGYIVKGPDFSLDAAVHLLNQQVFQPDLTEERLPKEISIITQEYKDHWDKPNSRFNRVIDELLYGKDHPYTKDALGTPESIANISIERLKELHQEYYQPENMVMTVTGKFEVHDCLQRLVKTLTPLVGTKVPRIATPNPKISGKKVEHLDDVKQWTIILLWPIPGSEASTVREERIISRMAAYILGGSPRSRLFLHLREEKGFVYRTGSTRSFTPKAGNFEAWCSTDEEKGEDAIQAMREVIYDFVQNPITEDEFNRAKKFLLAQYPLYYDSVDSIAEQITNDIFYDGRIYLPDELKEMMETITREEVSEWMRKYLTKKRELVAIMSSNK